MDEIQWRSPGLAQYMGGIHTNSGEDVSAKHAPTTSMGPLIQTSAVLHYFAHSPFFDGTSNNAILTTQANFNPSMAHLMQTREAFEGRLRTMQGLEFSVAVEPSQKVAPVAGGAVQANSGAWVIRKQMRRKRPGLEDEVTVLGTYFVIGENIYMSPSVGKVLGSRLVIYRSSLKMYMNAVDVCSQLQVSTVTSLSKFFSTAASLPTFSVPTGYTYTSSSSQPTSTSVANSKENTPMPETAPRPAKNPFRPENEADSEAIQEMRSFAESLSMAVRYGGEYMDENPLVGEPGSFVLSATHGQVQSKQYTKSTPFGRSAVSERPTQQAGLTANTPAAKSSRSEVKTPASPEAEGPSQASTSQVG